MRDAFQRTPERLQGLPAGFKLFTPEAQARALLTAKAKDATEYLTLRATAIRCAPEK